MRLVYGKYFWRSAKQLPHGLQEKLADLLDLLRENPFHSLLHTKPLGGKLKDIISFRITRDWRVTFHFIDESTIHLLEVGNRKDIYR